MSARTVKVAISLPKDTMDEIEKLRRELKWPRSQAILEAVSLWLKKRREEKWDREYAEAYRKHPEDPRELEPPYLAGLSSVEKDKW